MISTDPSITDWLKERGITVPTAARVIGVEYKGAWVGALIYHGFRWNQGRLIDMELTVQMERPESFTRTVMRAMLDYPFKQLQADRVTVLVEPGSKSERLAIYHGFRHEGTLRRLVGPDERVYGRLNE